MRMLLRLKNAISLPRRCGDRYVYCVPEGGTSVAQWSRWLAIFQRKPSSNLVEAHSSFFSSFLTLVKFGGPVFDLEISRTGKLEWKGRFQDLVHDEAQ